ncbi:MAG: hypothetical protein WBF81_02350 [Thermoplasmata archaeon]
MTDLARAQLALRITILVTVLLLVVQYVLGLWTSAYAPSSFTSNTSLPSLEGHLAVGYALGVVSLLALVFAGLTREVRVIVPAFALLLAVGLAGVFGMMFVRTTPNDPLDSVGMGIMFLVALGAAFNMAYYLRSRPASAPTPPPVATPSG